jgi:hypothetical protein
MAGRIRLIVSLPVIPPTVTEVHSGAKPWLCLFCCYVLSFFCLVLDEKPLMQIGG